MAALGVLRAHAAAGAAAAAAAGARRLGRRGGRALRPQPVRQLRVRRARSTRRSSATCATPTARPIAEVLAENGVELDAGARVRGARRDGLGAYLELHIEQGPRMEAERPAGRRGHRLRRRRAAALPASRARPRTPARRRWTLRRDAGLAAAAGGAGDRADPAEPRAAWRPPASCASSRGSRPRSPARRRWPSTCATPTRRRLARMLDRPRAAPAPMRPPSADCELAERPVWRIDPIPFDPGLVAAARESCAEVTGEPARARERRAPRRRRGRPSAAGGDDVLPLEGGNQPRQARRTPTRPTSRSRSRRSGGSPDATLGV